LRFNQTTLILKISFEHDLKPPMSADIFKVKNYKFKKFFSANMFEEKSVTLRQLGFFKLEHGFKNIKRMASQSAKKRIFKRTILLLH